MNDHSLPTRQKALTLNLDAKNYGTFAEIGGGQEVHRHHRCGRSCQHENFN